MTNEEKAPDHSIRRSQCSESLLTAFADKYVLTEEQALKIGGMLNA